MHPEVENLLKLVQQKTGYSVTVSRDETVTTHAAMQTATADTPVHYIRLNPKREQIANYLVAMQCRMILDKWADPQRIPGFAVRDDELSGLGKRLVPKSNIPLNAKVHLVRSLILQLTSLPAELMAADWCYTECPSLRDEQRACMNIQLQEASASLAPKIKTVAPPAVFDRNAGMNAALTLWWSQAEGSQVALLPYLAMGYLKQGEALLGDFRSVPATDAGRHPKIVDLWAARLDLKGCYAWRYRSA